MRHTGVLALLRKGPGRWPAPLLAALILLAGSQSVAVDLRTLAERVAAGPSLDPAIADTPTVARQDGDLRSRAGTPTVKAVPPGELAALLPALLVPTPAPRHRAPAAAPPAHRPSRRRTASPRAPPRRPGRD